MKTFLAILISLFLSYNLHAQTTLTEDTNAVPEKKERTIGGYANIFYQRNFNEGGSLLKLERCALFVRHHLNSKISFFSESTLEAEDDPESESNIIIHQAYLKYEINQNHYIIGGLFLPRIGFLNEHHLPEDFYGNERNMVETFVLPSLWRCIGLGIYGKVKSIPLYYSAAIVNGLNNAGFEHGSGITKGVFKGNTATANNLAFTGSLQYRKPYFSMQVSAYAGGSTGLPTAQADSLKLTSGLMGTPVILTEANMQWRMKGFSAKLLATHIMIPDAADINRAYANNTPQSEYGAYLEFAYSVFEKMKQRKSQQLRVFARYELLDLNADVPGNGIMDGTLHQQYFTAGLQYMPVKNLSLKVDVRLSQTGKENPDLVLNPNPGTAAYQQQNSFLNAGFGYSF